MMGYYNTAFKMGEERFVERVKEAGGVGYILPDLPVEEAVNLHRLSEEAGIEPIILMTPTSSDKRLAKLGCWPVAAWCMRWRAKVLPVQKPIWVMMFWR